MSVNSLNCIKFVALLQNFYRRTKFTICINADVQKYEIFAAIITVRKSFKFIFIVCRHWLGVWLVVLKNYDD